MSFLLIRNRLSGRWECYGASEELVSIMAEQAAIDGELFIARGGV